MSLNNLFNLFDVFNRNTVEYLVVGGTAVSFYGEPRKSKLANGQLVDKPDLDFWYNPNYVNYFKLIDALEELGRDVAKYRNEQAPDPRKSVFKDELDDYTLDILPQIYAPLNFRDCFTRRTIVEHDGVEIPIISLNVIRDKEALGREKDVDDIENLRRANPTLSGN